MLTCEQEKMRKRVINAKMWTRKGEKKNKITCTKKDIKATKYLFFGGLGKLIYVNHLVLYHDGKWQIP